MRNKSMSELIIIMGIICAFLIAIVSIASIIMQNEEKKISEANDFSVRYVRNYTDPETGVNYIFYHDPTTGSVTISVRYNSDGKVMVTPVVKVKSISNDIIDKELVTNG